MCYTLLFFTLLLLVSSSFCAKQKCCPDRECYELGDPWQTLLRLVPEPRCIEDPARYLFTNSSNAVYPSVFTTGNISKITDFLDVTKPTLIVIPTWLSSEDSSAIRNVTTVYVSRVNANGIFVDYGKVAMNLNYPQVVSDIRVVARHVIKMVQTIIKAGVSPSKIHLVGFNVGAHLAAYVAKAIPGIGRLTGLDPARFLFTDQNCEVRLCKGDAQFTETIHTNGNPVWGFGTSIEDGDVDLWVNGGWDQPNCGVVVNPLAILQIGRSKISEVVTDLFFCSLRRAVLYYTEALASSCVFWGVKPDPLNMLISRLTLGHATKFIVHPRNCTLQNCVPVGLDTIHATGRGSFIVPTNYQQPFCVSQ
ncbi:phospholipase A1-like isoform X1 [Cryptotermes secundus]|uniref:phospholipase A1-like isoform X1 n=1 Tax=Cryptotermes secundus TaxID=105785 RepID=UPI000CD7B162|nr:phospholipase A1-like isoform X1 [Cryptotermes secundus]